jgi:hypothetical protein
MCLVVKIDLGSQKPKQIFKIFGGHRSAWHPLWRLGSPLTPPGVTWCLYKLLIVVVDGKLWSNPILELIKFHVFFQQNHQSRDYDANPGFGLSQHSDDSWLELAVADAGRSLGSSKRGHKVNIFICDIHVTSTL